MMNNQSKQVVLGAGQLGLAIMDELVAQGQDVKLVNRSGRLDENLPEQVELVAADLSQPANVAEVCQGADIVFFCVQPPYGLYPI